MISNEKGSIVAVVTEDYNYKKQIKETPIQELELEPGFTFEHALHEIKKMPDLETRIDSLEIMVAKQKAAINGLFELIETMLVYLEVNGVEYENILTKLRALGGK